MVTKLKTGGIYKLLYDEDLYPFYDKNKAEYSNFELHTKSYQPVKKGTILTYIKSIIEVSNFKSRKNQKNWTSRKLEMPVFYYNDRLVVPYTTYNEILTAVEEVVDETP